MRAKVTRRFLPVRRDRELCDQTWETFDAPDGFRQGNIRIPGAATPMSIETMVCSPEFRNLGLEVVDNSGLFRTQFLLSREEAFGGTPVKFTAVLEGPTLRVK